jgi:RNA polymerase sigma-70 factor (ECF subfamily)
MDARALLDSLMPERARFVRLARSRVGSDADAEDLVQRALTRAVDRVSTLDDPTKAQAWFYSILRRAIVDHLRGGAADPLRFASELELDSIADGSAATATTACTCGLKLLEDVRPAYREVVRRIDVEGHDPSAVASDLGITLDNLHVRLHRARRALRDDIEEYCCVTTLGPCLDCACDGESRCGSAPRPAPVS